MTQFGLMKHEGSLAKGFCKIKYLTLVRVGADSGSQASLLPWMVICGYKAWNWRIHVVTMKMPTLWRPRGQREESESLTLLNKISSTSRPSSYPNLYNSLKPLQVELWPRVSVTTGRKALPLLGKTYAWNSAFASGPWPLRDASNNYRVVIKT